MPDMIDEIRRLKKERNALILAHNYVLPEIQEIADFLGDSLELSIKARDAHADVIVFCGVKFMAETAKILSPERTVLLPVPDAGCPMADMAGAEQVRAYRKQYPNAVAVCYVNSTAEVKAEVDICCTSSNVDKIIGLIPPERDIIFLPDINLGANISNKLNRKMLFWPGFCPIHHHTTPEMIREARAAHPNAIVLVHPECPVEVTAEADYALSTGGILQFARESDAQEFIVGTEYGILNRLRNENPGKKFFELPYDLTCPDMKKTKLEDVLNSLQNMVHQVELAPELMDRARLPITRMLELKL
jgi:quinolinate synthase